ncbi:MAG: YHS domain-containing protein [Armatimonadota bacterium]
MKKNILVLTVLMTFILVGAGISAKAPVKSTANKAPVCAKHAGCEVKHDASKTCPHLNTGSKSNTGATCPMTGARSSAKSSTCMMSDGAKCDMASMKGASVAANQSRVKPKAGQKPKIKAKQTAQVVCPVMKSKISNATKGQYGKSVYKGKTYYFCCDGCKPLFDKNPEKYIKK